jgi:hypothetical protein
MRLQVDGYKYAEDTFGLTARQYHRHAETAGNRLFSNIIQEEIWK